MQRPKILFTSLTHLRTQNLSRNFEMTCFKPTWPFFLCRSSMMRCVRWSFDGRIIGAFISGGRSAFSSRPRTRSNWSLPICGLRDASLLEVETWPVVFSCFRSSENAFSWQYFKSIFSDWAWSLILSSESGCFRHLAQKNEAVHYYSCKFTPDTESRSSLSKDVFVAYGCERNRH